ncbi:MAG: formyltransferase family protein [Patescibacteria group bacterium]
MDLQKPKVLIFASGTKNGGGSGFRNLILQNRRGVTSINYVGVVSNHENGGVRDIAEELGIPFYYSPTSSWTAEKYQEVAARSGADYFALSGWMIKIKGLDLNTKFNQKTVFNIHPAPLPRFGGQGMYGIHAHEAVWASFLMGEITETEITMHFVDEEFDHGLVIFRLHISFEGVNSPEELAQKVNKYEHMYQAYITNLIVNGLLSWDGINPESLIVPLSYQIDHKVAA